MPELRTYAYGALHLSEATSDDADGAFVWLRASSANSLGQPLTDRAEVVLRVSLDDLKRFMQQAQFLLNYHQNVVERDG